MMSYLRLLIEYEGVKLIGLGVLMLLSSMTEGVGITLFLPLLSQIEFSSSADSRIIDAYESVFAALGIPFTLSFILASIVLVFFLKFTVTFSLGALSAEIQASIVRTLRLRAIRAYERIDHLRFIEYETGTLNNLVSTEIPRASKAFLQSTQFLVGALNVAVYVVIALMMNWQVTGIAVVFAVLSFFALRAIWELTKRYSLETSDKNGKLQSLVLQVLRYNKYLKATNSFPPLDRKIREQVDRLASLEFRVGVANTLMRAIPEPLSVTLAVVIAYFHLYVMNLAVSSLVILILVSHRAATTLGSLSNYWQRFCALVGGLEIVHKTLEDMSEHAEAEGGVVPPPMLRDRIRMENLTFAFGSEEILNSVTVEIGKSDMIAIVGASGAGKTTFVDLLTATLRPSEGEIYFDSEKYTKLDLLRLREKFGYVTQDQAIFNDTIENNITLWNEDGDPTDPEKLEGVLRDAHCWEFIEALPEGVRTVIGEQGVKLSGGQRQRLAIARELYRDREVLIFDEATSALDSRSEEFVHDSIVSLKGKKTIVIIAHRLSTVRNCDQILVFKEGRIVERGSFEELYSRPRSVFREMCDRQELRGASRNAVGTE